MKKKPSPPSRTRVAKRFRQTGPSSAEAWAKLRALAGQPGIINLGQGFPDFIPMPEAIDFAKQAMDKPELNQYASMGGSIRLKKALSAYYGKAPSRDAVGSGSAAVSLPFDPNTEITVTTSGTEAVYCIFQALVNPGDTVVVMEPSFPWYSPAIKLAGGIPLTIELQPPTFSILHHDTLRKLRSVFDSCRPKIIVVNTPHNPTGHVMTAEELDEIEALCLKYKTIIVSDEVYERCIFDGHRLESVRHRRHLASNTLTIGSSSKLLSMTGWRVGWVLGNAEFIRAIKVSSGYTTFCAPTPFQDACAAILETSMKTRDWSFGNVSSLFSINFQRLKDALESIGLIVCAAEGGYFLTADVTSTQMTDMEFVEHLAETCKIAALPMRLFYQDPPKNGRALVRFAVCKKEQTILKTVDALKLFVVSAPSS